VHEQYHRDACRTRTIEEVLSTNDRLDEGIAYARGAACVTDALLNGSVDVNVDPLGPDNSVGGKQ
jgi:hypothetical protein